VKGSSVLAVAEAGANHPAASEKFEKVKHDRHQPSEHEPRDIDFACRA
jgi:hypothetical protein